MGGRDPGTDKTIGILLTIVVLGTLLQVAVATGDERPPAPPAAPSPLDPQVKGVAPAQSPTLPTAIEQGPAAAVRVQPPAPVPVGGVQPSDAAIAAPPPGLAPARRLGEERRSIREGPPIQILRHQTPGEAPQQRSILGGPRTDSVSQGAIQGPLGEARREPRREIKR